MLNPLPVSLLVKEMDGMNCQGKTIFNPLNINSPSASKSVSRVISEDGSIPQAKSQVATVRKMFKMATKGQSRISVILTIQP